MSASARPRGIRNNNPGNLRPLGAGKARVLRVGELLDIDPDGYSRFDTPENGIRAIGVDLLTKYRKRLLNTVAKIIARYAPTSENDTDAYIRHVCQLTGFYADQPLEVDDPATLDALVAAIIRHENGIPPRPDGWYPDEVLARGVARALE